MHKVNKWEINVIMQPCAAGNQTEGRSREDLKRIALTQRELATYRLHHTKESIQIMPLTRIVLPDFIKNAIPPVSKKDKQQDLCIEGLGEKDSAGIESMRNDKKLNENMKVAAKIRKSVERSDMRGIRNAQELVDRVDELVEKRFLKPRVRSVERKHNPWQGMEELFGKMTIAAFAKGFLNKSSEKNTGKLNMRDVLLHKKAKRLNKDVKIPTLEEVERRKRKLPKLSKKVSNKTFNFSSIVKQEIKNSQREEYVIKDYDQMCAAANKLAAAFTQGGGNELLDKYRECFQSRNHHSSSASVSSRRHPHVFRKVTQAIRKMYLLTKKN
eukprot:TRINITY_DN12468_c0_g1_i3.p1 TRINITY_DN12468_c0_g1~~TRINITY_DN12468_c0_g1_i3.p1  ORF type:complete len:327 (+),score=74.63 TRINITY_DN12468_c0_g1_i3:79-1059(+)